VVSGSQDLIRQCLGNKKIILMFFTVVGLLLISTNAAYADCDLSTSGVQPGCFTFDSGDGYVVGHGMRVNVTDSSPGPNPTITVTETDNLGNPIATSTPVQLNMNTNIPGIVYLNTYLMLTPGITSCSSCDPPNLQVDAGKFIQVSYTHGSSVITSNVQPIVSDNPSDPSWPSSAVSGVPQPDTTVVISCSAPTGRAGSSGDYICDDWKTSTGLNIPYTDNAGNTVHYTWPCTDDPVIESTNPTWDFPCPKTNHKDVYVQVDWMQNHGPSKSAIQNVINAYKNNGIFLHAQYGNEVPHMALITGPNNGADTTDYTNIKKIFFGNSTDRSCDPSKLPAGFNGDCSTYISDRLTAKRQVFHYALFAHQQSNNAFSSGKSEVASSSPWGAGNDILVSLGSFSYAVGSPDQQAGTFMHELGHNLGLDHGGPYKIATDSSVNCKPNYLSTMSWTRQFSDLFGSSGRPIDYSEKAQVAWLKFEGNPSDSSGTGNTGTGGTSSNYVAPGKILNAYQFDGTSSSSITLANNGGTLNFDVNTPFSISFWAKVPTSNGATIQPFVTQETPNTSLHNKGWYVWMYGSNHLLYFSINDGVTLSQVSTPVAINDGLWHHYVATYSGTGSNSAMNLYMDGSSNSIQSQVSGSIQNTPAYTVNVGANGGGNFRPASGVMIDELQMYNTALTSSQVQSLFKEGLSDNQKAWLKFERVLDDSSGTNHNGVVASGSASYTSSGKVGNAFSFDSTNYFHLVNNDNALSFDVANPFSISFWAKIPTSVGGTTQEFVSQQVSGTTIHNKGWYIWMYGSTHLLYFTLNSGGSSGPLSQVISTGTVPDDANWHQYVVTYSGASSGSVMKIYIDGVFNNQVVSSVTNSIQSTPANPVNVGANGGGNWRLQNGVLMDELQMYNTELTLSQINLIYRQTALGYDYTLNSNPVTENPITGIPDKYTVFYTGSAMSQPVRADTSIDWDLDNEAPGSESTEPASTLIPPSTTAFTTPALGMNPVTVSISCPPTQATTFTSWDDWHNLMFDMTTTSSFADGAGSTVVYYHVMVYVITALFIIAAVLAAVVVWKKRRRVKRIG